MSGASSITDPARGVHDPPLGAAYQRGALDDFDRLYRDSHSHVLRKLVGVARDRSAAHECVQDAFFTVSRIVAVGMVEGSHTPGCGNSPNPKQTLGTANLTRWRW